MRKRLQVLFILIFGINNYITAQYTDVQNQYDPRINSVPTSPEVALLGRFGDVPVGHYTGTAQISIPLYNLKVDNIEIPLTLSYHTSGIKVADEATWVGLGWNFLPEGTITQEIRGREDSVFGGDGFSTVTDYDKFKSNFPTLYSENQNYRLQVGYHDYNSVNFVVVNPNHNDSYDVINRLKEKKGQPDIFTYNFYGYSGKFFYNPENANEILFLESNDDVKFSRTSQGWTATTNKGDKFYFHTVENSKTDQTDYTDIGYTFKISEIVLISGKSIKFTYQDESTYQNYPVQVARLTNFSTCSNCAVTSSNNATINEKKTLIKIETNDTTVDFNLDNREDIRPRSSTNPIKRLISIDIKARLSNKKIKSLNFNQTYFPYPQNITLEEGYKFKRLKLNSIQEITYDSDGNPIQNLPPYSFEYDLTNMMPSKMASSDFFGYNNGSTGTDLLPNLDYFDYLSKSPYKHYGYTPTFSYNKSIRYANYLYTLTNILIRINYPTNGYTIFDFESNTFKNQFIPTQKQINESRGGASYAHRGPNTGDTVVKILDRFKLNQTTRVTFNNYIYDGYNGYYPANHTDFAIVQSSCRIEFIKVNNVNGQYQSEKIKVWDVINVLRNEFELTHQKAWNETLEIPYDSNPTTEYYVVIVNGVQSGFGQPIVSCSYSYIDKIDESISYGNGLRIKAIKNYDSDNILLSHKEYEYEGGKLLYKFDPINVIKAATHKSQPGSQTGGCFVESLSLFNDLSVSSNDFGISGNKPFGYSTVIEKDINVVDGTEKGFTKYFFNNQEQSGTSIKGIPKIENPANGENTRIEKYDQNQDIVWSKSMFYNNLANTYGIYPSFHMLNTSTGPYDPFMQAYPALLQGCSGGSIVVGQSYLGNTYVNPSPTTKYNFIFSPLITGKRRLMSTTETQYFNVGNIETKIENTYSANGNLKISKTTTSEGKSINTKYFYAEDLAHNRLINKNMIGIPLITYVSSNDVTYNQVEIKYDHPNNYFPSSVVKLDVANNSLVEEVTYDSYDNKGNLLQYTTKSGISTGIIWGYNQTQPIAKIEGATYAQVSSVASDIVTASNEDASDADIDNPKEQALINALDSFRTKPALSGFQITTYSYDPLIGVRSITPPNGVREIYIYDTANRLAKVVDVNGNILKEYKYNYKQ